tara:strand:- start:1315 stop:1812 length:498 start_codon:yes stop_codon:yes gene_type:complete
MKETKKFFDNNRLNRGYSRVANARQNDNNLIRKKYQHALPPIDMMEQYEELNPGTFEKLFDMAVKEQNHRHSMDLLTMEKHSRATRLGRIFALVYIAIISITTLVLVVSKSIISASVFVVSSFACITIISCFYSKKSIPKEFMHNKQNKPRPYTNNNYPPRQARK